MTMLTIFVAFVALIATLQPTHIANACQENVYMEPPGDMQYIRSATYTNAYFGVASDVCWHNEESEGAWRKVSKGKYCHIPFGIYSISASGDSMGPAITMHSMRQLLVGFDYNWDAVPFCVAVVADADKVSASGYHSASMCIPRMCQAIPAHSRAAHATPDSVRLSQSIPHMFVLYLPPPGGDHCGQRCC